MYIIFYIIYTHIFINNSNDTRIKKKNPNQNWCSSNTFTTFPSGRLNPGICQDRGMTVKKTPPTRNKLHKEYCITTNFFIQKPIFKKNVIMNLFGQTTTLSSRHTVKMAWLRIDRIVHDLLTASCHAHGLLLLLLHRHDRDLWI